jgi:hypothetical protein
VDVSFVSGVWFPTGSSWHFVPKPGRLVSRLFWTTRPPAPKQISRYLNSIVMGLRPTCAGMPVIGAFLDAHYDARGGSGYVLDKRVRVWQTNKAVERSELLIGFCARYGLAVGDVEDCERFLLANSGRVGIVSHPVLDRMMEVDLADLADRPVSF